MRVFGAEAQKRGRVILVAIGVLCGTMAMSCRDASLSSEFERLVRGDESVSIVSFRMAGQGIEVCVDDAVAVEYLARASRLAKEKWPDARGYSYQCSITFGSGATALVGADAPEGANGFYLTYPYGSLHDNPKQYWVSIEDPVPASVTKMLRAMKSRKADRED